VFRLHGVLIPRDSDQQFRFGRKKTVGDVNALVTGDLLFFGKSDAQITHVAMYLSNGRFLHAHGEVCENTLIFGHDLHAPKLVNEWRGTRDPLNL
jgi:cell wall-associated NlpC family hydrolase